MIFNLFLKNYSQFSDKVFLFPKLVIKELNFYLENFKSPKTPQLSNINSQSQPTFANYIQWIKSRISTPKNKSKSDSGDEHIVDNPTLNDSTSATPLPLNSSLNAILASHKTAIDALRADAAVAKTQAMASYEPTYAAH